MRESTNAAPASAPRRSTRLSISSNQGIEQPNTTPRKRKRRSQSLPSPTKETAGPSRRRANTLDISPKATNKTIEKVKGSRKSRKSPIASNSLVRSGDFDQSYDSDASVAESSVDDETDSGLGKSNEEEDIFTIQEVVDYYIEGEALEGLNVFKQRLIGTEEEKVDLKGFWKELLEKRVGLDIESMRQIEEELVKKDFGQLLRFYSHI